MRRDCTAIALSCRQLPEREYHYFAVDCLRRHVRHCSSAFLPAARHLITTVARWDTVDPLAVHVVGALVATDPASAVDMDAWITDDDLWVVRTALLHQLCHKERTYAERLFAYCLRQSGHPDFFVRKAIGWSLRVCQVRPGGRTGAPGAGAGEARAAGGARSAKNIGC